MRRDPLHARRISRYSGYREALLRDIIRQHQVYAIRCGRIYKIPKRGIEKLLEGGEAADGSRDRRIIPPLLHNSLRHGGSSRGRRRQCGGKT